MLTNCLVVAFVYLSCTPFLKGDIVTYTIESVMPIGWKQCQRECRRTVSCVNVRYSKEHLHCTLIGGNLKENNEITVQETSTTCPNNTKEISLRNGMNACIIVDCPYSSNLVQYSKFKVGALASADYTATCQLSTEMVCQATGFWIPTPNEGAVKIHTHGSRGLLFVYYNSRWGTVCDDLFNATDANVVCRMLGYVGGTTYTYGAVYQYGGETKYDIWLDDVQCTGSASCLTECSHLEWGDHNCVQNENVGVDCY